MTGEHPQREGLGQLGSFLLLLASADAAFILVHFLRDFPPFDSSRLFSVETDKGYAEIFQYVKISWITLLLGMLWWRRRGGIFFAWMLLFAYLLCDDAMQLHEHGGSVVARTWGFDGALGLRAKDFGELAVTGAAGLAFLLLLLVMYRRSETAAREASRRLAFYLGIVVFFGVVVDMIHILSGNDGSAAILGAVEDGGEMVAVSIVCWYALNLVESRDGARASLRQFVT